MSQSISEEKKMGLWKIGILKRKDSHKSDYGDFKP
jgi:hypothetical protein